MHLCGAARAAAPVSGEGLRAPAQVDHGGELRLLLSAFTVSLTMLSQSLDSELSDHESSRRLYAFPSALRELKQLA